MQPPPDCGAGPGEEPPALCLLQHDMEGCYSRLRRLVPSIPQHRRVSRTSTQTRLLLWSTNRETASCAAELLQGVRPRLSQEERPRLCRPGRRQSNPYWRNQTNDTY
ncbi:hypothetical protein NDU88_005034 [Pleurodeles waltl]|uniref:Uncharacterized protein n=1 Tax=Pleurodeles waltl TaxID=8319 RepID=A0AAV7VKS7_PLEWA|nr:hypothetical protein NDU88_005034 [Pleurodeles waltl]